MLTAATVRRLSPAALADLFMRQEATSLPVGVFTGRAWSHDLPFVRVLSAKIWQGKVFAGSTVRNRMLGRLLIPGEVRLDVRLSERSGGGVVVINYPQLGLWDELRPLTATLWLGRMQLGEFSVIWFTLTKV